MSALSNPSVFRGLNLIFGVVVACLFGISITSKSPKEVARKAYEAGKRALARYAHKYSRRDYTCAQLFAILVLRKMFKQDYRGTEAYLYEWSDL